MDHPIPTAAEYEEIYREMQTGDAPVHHEHFAAVAWATLCEAVVEKRRRDLAEAERDAEQARRDAAPLVAAWRSENA